MSASLKSGGWRLWVTAVISFACGSAITAHLTHPARVNAQSGQVFQLMVYHTLPGKVPALESVFQDVSKLQAKHGLNAVGYWVPNNDAPEWKDTFVYLIPHTSLDDAKKNWDALHADAAFPPYFKAAAPLIKQVNGVYQVEGVFMQPADYSAMK